MKRHIENTDQPAKPSVHLAAYRPALTHLNAALARATTPSDLTLAEQLDLIRLRLFGCLAE